MGSITLRAPRSACQELRNKFLSRSLVRPRATILGKDYHPLPPLPLHRLREFPVREPLDPPLGKWPWGADPAHRLGSPDPRQERAGARPRERACEAQKPKGKTYGSRESPCEGVKSGNPNWMNRLGPRHPSLSRYIPRLPGPLYPLPRRHPPGKMESFIRATTWQTCWSERWV
jgi:hypothetical protein